jgi:hypothetical protein
VAVLGSAGRLWLCNHCRGVALYAFVLHGMVLPSFVLHMPALGVLCLAGVRWMDPGMCLIPGLQVLADDLCGWGSLTLRILQEVRDQYSQQPVMYFSIQQQQQQQQVLGPQLGATSTQLTR